MSSAVRDVRGRTWALAGVAVALAVGLCLLGAWQWRVAVQQDAAPLPADPAAPVAELAAVGQPLDQTAAGRLVSARGTYDGSATLLVTGHRLAGRDGSWLLLPLRTDAGAVLPVVRGFLPTGAPVPPAPTGTVTVTGRLQPPYAAADGPRGAAEPGPGQVAAVETADLVNRWGGPIHPAFVLAEQELTPQGTMATAPARVPAEPPGARTTIQLRNLAYAVQWFAFSLFVLLFWVRLARDDVQAARRVPAVRRAA